MGLCLTKLTPTILCNNLSAILQKLFEKKSDLWLVCQGKHPNKPSKNMCDMLPMKELKPEGSFRHGTYNNIFILF